MWSLCRLSSGRTLNLSSKISTGGGFEWDDDFSSPAPAFLPKTDAGLPSKSSSSPFSSPPQAAGRPSEPSWSSSSSYSRFSISPASIASFSLTHLTDSDIEQGGASATLLENMACLGWAGLVTYPLMTYIPMQTIISSG